MNGPERIEGAVLVIIARYPTAGRCKTRLIPAIGPERAAQLHHIMLMRTLRTARNWKHDSNGSVVLCHDGGDEAAWRYLCGHDLRFEPQSQGDLGARLASIVDKVIQDGARQVVLVGTDCPALQAAHVSRAFDMLREVPVVFGPAVDGGYYLVGFSTSHSPSTNHSDQVMPHRVILSGIDWGTEQVFTQSRERARGQQLEFGLLPLERDIDRPEDLHDVVAKGDHDDIAEWIESLSSQPELDTPPWLSVVIPTWNREPALGRVLQSVLSDELVEAIVVASGDHDDSISQAREAGAICITTAPGRAHQLNQGARLSRGQYLLFLHADTLVPPQFRHTVMDTLASTTNALGAFRLRIDDNRPLLRWIEWGVGMRSRWFQLPYGDQGLCMRAATWRVLGGFPEQPCMEDYELVRRARRVGRVVTFGDAVTTSNRRWRELGPLRVTLVNQCMLLGYSLGIPAHVLARWYRRPFPFDRRPPQAWGPR